MIKYKRKPWKHQEEIIQRAKAHQNFAILADTGTGKSLCYINILRHWYAEKLEIGRTCVFTPGVTLRNHQDEWFENSSIRPESIAILGGPGAKRVRDFNRKVLEGSTRIILLNYESLLMEPLFKLLKEWRPEYLVFDESHRLKNPRARRSIKAEELANPDKDPPRKLLLTGSPVLNSPLDLFQQMKVMDGGKLFGRNFFVFRGRYFRDINAGMPRNKYFPNWKIRPNALEEINSKLASKSVSIRKEDCLDLPPLIKKTIYVEMSPKQARLYKEMRNDFVTYMEDRGKQRAAVATLALTKGMRLQQIASGYVKFEDGGEIAFDDCPKIKALKELLEDLTETNKVIVWACWKANYEQIRKVCESLKLDYVEVHGEISNADKFEAINRFNKDPKYKVFIGNPGAGGIGINLVVAPSAIYFSRGFSLEHSLQSMARNYRGGSDQHEKVVHFDLISEGTIEELILKRLNNKEEIGSRVLAEVALEI